MRCEKGTAIFADSDQGGRCNIGMSGYNAQLILNNFKLKLYATVISH